MSLSSVGWTATEQRGSSGRFWLISIGWVCWVAKCCSPMSLLCCSGIQSYSCASLLLIWVTVGLVSISLVPRPAQLFVTYSYGKAGRAWYLLKWVWCNQQMANKIGVKVCIFFNQLHIQNLVCMTVLSPPPPPPHQLDICGKPSAAQCALDQNQSLGIIPDSLLSYLDSLLGCTWPNYCLLSCALGCRVIPIVYWVVLACP